MSELEWNSLNEPPNPELIINLNLSYKNLHKLPDWVIKCKNLQILYCNDNKIESLEGLSLTLQLLNCSGNQIISLEGSLTVRHFFN